MDSRPCPPTNQLSDERRAIRIDAITGQLVGSVVELIDSELWAAVRRAAEKFPPPSYPNLLLLQEQAEERGLDLSLVTDADSWRSLGRTVRPGERALVTVEPRLNRIESGEDWSLVGVELVQAQVFDLSQTEGRPLPQQPEPRPLTCEDTAGLWEPLTGLVVSEGYRLIREAPTEPGCNGWTNHERHTVSVRPDIGGAHATAVLAHELGHIRAGHADRRISVVQMETEAEAIAHAVMTANGLDTTASAVPYIASWIDHDRTLLVGAANRACHAAARILADIAKHDARAASASTSARARWNEPRRDAPSRGPQGPAQSS